MKSMNRAQLIGYLGENPQIIQLPQGGRMLKLRLATDTFQNNDSSQPKKFTDWHIVKVWGEKIIRHCLDHCMAGSHVLVEGTIAYRMYVDANGHRRFAADILAHRLIDLDR